MFEEDVVVYENLTSTQDELRAFFLQNHSYEKIRWVRALCQSAGRGRQGKTWLNHNPENLTISCGFLLPQSITKQELPFVTLMSGFVLYQTIQEYLKISKQDKLLSVVERRLFIKWPNDLCAWPDSGEGQVKKIAGILVESFVGKVVPVVAGFGVNVKSGVSELSWSTCLEDVLGCSIETEVFYKTLRNVFNKELSQWCAAPEKYVAQFIKKLSEGPLKNFWGTQGEVAGLGVAWAQSLNGDGSLCVRCQDGKFANVSAGEFQCFWNQSAS